MGILENIINPFTDTNVLKGDSSLENDLEKLKELKTKLGENELIEKQIANIKKGINGEEKIIYELKNANLGLYVLRDITLKYEDMTAQIDFIVISKGYTYLIECKNLIGNIYIDNGGQYTREYEYNGKKIKEAIFSPFTQSQRHIDLLKKIWLAKSSKLSVLFRKDYFDKLWYKPLVVLANDKSILNTRYAPEEEKNYTIRLDQLVNYIKKDIENYDKLLLMSKKEMEEFAQKFIEDDYTEKSGFSEKYKKMFEDDILLGELKEFRKEKSKKRNIPAYYIFTDAELDNIIKNIPKTVDDLTGLLSPEKIKYHGDEIIEIIKKYKD